MKPKKIKLVNYYKKYGNLSLNSIIVYFPKVKVEMNNAKYDPAILAFLSYQFPANCDT